MAYTQAQLDAIEAAIADGALTVKYSDKEVTYRSLDDMLRIRNMIRQSLGLASSGSTRIKAEFSKGFTSDDDE